LVIIDPPYGVDFYTNHRKIENENIGSILNDNNEIFESLKTLMLEFHRVLKENTALYCFCRWDVYPKFKELIEPTFQIKNLLIWKKNNWSMGDLDGAYASQYECIIFATKGRHILNNGRGTDILEFDRIGSNNLLHSHQKPEPLIKYIINKSSKIGDTVLDCFLGSGTTLYACQNTGRSCIGVEMDQRYIDIINKRCLNRNLLGYDVDYVFIDCDTTIHTKPKGWFR